MEEEARGKVARPGLPRNKVSGRLSRVSPRYFALQQAASGGWVSSPGTHPSGQPIVQAALKGP